ncbi:DNA/RNA non-specific endonuclease [Pseudalkalibacillus decolorationis]|uniref:DNA/RNA non-specific endonuclease n=1 Tax=Pseudalkalibacillus decolorationis TaxID=163879 RepID=UPI003557A630
MVPMNGKLVNQGSYKRLENQWKSAPESGQEVFVDVTPKFKGDSTRPNEFVIKYKIEGKETIRRLDNP